MNFLKDVKAFRRDSFDKLSQVFHIFLIKVAIFHRPLKLGCLTTLKIIKLNYCLNN
jgi:hypothetical protein